MNMAGKGCKPRPVDIKKYRDNWDEIDWRNSTDGRRIVGLCFCGDIDEIKKELVIQDKKVQKIKTPKGKATRYVY